MALALCLSCSKMEHADTVGAAMTFNARIAGGYGTKAAVTGTSLPTSRTLTLAAAHDGATYFSGLSFTHSAGTTWSNATSFWPLTGTLDILGYSVEDASHVSSVSWGSNASTSVSLALSDNRTNQDDVVFACGVGMTPASNALSFQHAESLVSCTVRSNVAYDATANTGFTVSSVTFRNVYNSGSVTCTRSGAGLSFAWSSLGSQADATIPSAVPTHCTTSAAEISTVPGLLLPQQPSCGAIRISYTYHVGKDGGGNNIDNNYTYDFVPPATTWTAGGRYVYAIYITESSISVTLAEDITWEDLGPFGGLYLSDGPLYYNGSGYGIHDSWNYTSYNSLVGPADGSTYFNFVQLGQIFEKADFATTDGSIDNVVDPFDGWHVPSKAEWDIIVGTSRRGANVNGTPSIHFAIVRVTGVTHGGQIPYGPAAISIRPGSGCRTAGLPRS